MASSTQDALAAAAGLSTDDVGGPARWIVGHDGSDGATTALRWAIANAAGSKVELTAVRTWQLPALEFPVPVAVTDDFAPTDICEDFAAMQDSAQSVGVTLDAEIVRGATTHALLDQSDAADLLVLGSRGLGGFGRLVLGSVSSQCAAHARVPTVVIPEPVTPYEQTRRVVVGLDGSDRSLAALSWAMNFLPADCEITVVGAWTQSKSGFVAVTQHYTGELDEARQRFHEIVDGIDAKPTGRDLQRHFAYADPSYALLQASVDADLLVVGRRGHSGLAGAFLGSVATSVLHRSEIPVAVVPPPA